MVKLSEQNHHHSLFDLCAVPTETKRTTNVLIFRTIQQLDPKPLWVWVNSPGGKAKWAIDLWPLRAKGLIINIV